MLLSLLSTLGILGSQRLSLAFWLVGAALIVLVVDVLIAIRENVPVNLAIQNRDAVYSPEQIEAFRATMVRAFYKAERPDDRLLRAG